MPTKPLFAIALDRRARLALRTQLSVALKQIIQRGGVRPGDAMPSSRDLADQLRVSRNTVVAALDQLVGEGYLEARERSGLFVVQIESSTPLLGGRPRRSPAVAPIRRAAPGLDAPRTFRPCQPDVKLFPLDLWNRMRSRALKRHGSALLSYHHNLALGLPLLRQRIAEYLRDSRGVNCAWEQIAITSGSQQALYCIAQLLLKRNDRVLMEDPGYAGAKAAWASAQARIVPWAVDVSGLVVPPNSTKETFIYLTPSRQFPTGACMPIARRLAWLDYARHAGSWIIEDDYDSEFRYASPPVASLQGLDRDDRVIYIGSMSKVLVPALRIGYVVLPPSLVAPFVELRAVIDDYGPLIDQAALAEFMDAGALYTHIRRCRREYAARQDTFLDAMRRADLPLTFAHTDGGMNVAGVLPNAVGLELDRALVNAGLDVPSLNSYALRFQAPGLVFGFTAFDHATIRGGVAAVAKVLRPFFDY